MDDLILCQHGHQRSRRRRVAREVTVDERTSVEQFIRSSGFPLEFAAARELRSAGFVPRHGRTYEAASQSGEIVYREIDVLAELIDSRLAMPAQVVVECKHAKAPWVVIAGDLDPDPAVAPIQARQARRPSDPVAAAIRRTLGIEPPLAFAVVELRPAALKPNQVDAAFDAVRQVLSAATGATRLVAKKASTLLHPIVVLDGHLWRYQDGKELERVDRARFVWWGEPAGPVARVVDVVTRDGFGPDYLLELRNELVATTHAIRAVPVRPSAVSF